MKIYPGDAFVISCKKTVGQLQSARTKPTFGLLHVRAAPAGAGATIADVPASITGCGCRAKAHESWRERCVDAACVFCDSSADGEFRGVNPDDTAVGTEEDGFLSGEDEDEADADGRRRRQWGARRAAGGWYLGPCV